MCDKINLIHHFSAPNPLSTEEQFTPLHFSCRYLPNIRDDAINLGRDEQDNSITVADTCRAAIQLLIQHRDIDVNIKNIYGVSSLHMACSRGNTVALEELLKSCQLDLFVTDNHGDTALHEACLLGDSEIVEMLLTAMERKGINVLLPNNDGQTPLHFACKKGIIYQLLWIKFTVYLHLKTIIIITLETLFLSSICGIISLIPMNKMVRRSQSLTWEAFS